MSDRIVLAGLLAEGRHGVHDWEREALQPFLVDVELHLDLRPAGTTDDLTRTADYSAVARLVRGVVAERSHRLIEGLAEAIAAAVLSQHPLVDAVVVRVSKPGVPEAGSPDGPMVEIRRARAG